MKISKQLQEQIEARTNDRRLENGKQSMQAYILGLSVNQLVKFCHQRAVDAGWHKKETEIGTDIALIHSELSEALEGVRRDLMDDHLPHRKMFEVELADAVIRIFNLAGKCGLDLGGAFYEKLEYNLSRLDHKPENRQKEGGKAF